MIAIAVLAPVFAVWAWYLDLTRALQAFYGPGGPIALRPQFYQELSTGSKALQQRDFVEAEARYRAALKLAESSQSENDWTGWYNVPAALVGLADALTGQGRFDAAEPLYARALAIGEEAWGPDHRAVAEVLEHYAVSLRQAGRAADSDRFLARAKAIRAKPDGR
jgi:tetratricopeptide (TPR) repeat protein